MIIVLMGVSGAGKSTIGALLAERMGAVFADADDYHPAANKAKMSAGLPLNDDDRQPWLDTLHRVLLGWAMSGTSGVLACSALKARYRDTLRNGIATETIVFCLLELPRPVLEARLTARKHEFMTPALLDSQLATLETPAEALVVVNDRAPEVVADEILARLPHTQH